MYPELPTPKTTLNFLPLKHDGGSWTFTEDHRTACRTQGGSPTLSRRITANRQPPALLGLRPSGHYQRWQLPPPSPEDKSISIIKDSEQSFKSNKNCYWPWRVNSYQNCPPTGNNQKIRQNTLNDCFEKEKKMDERQHKTVIPREEKQMGWTLHSPQLTECSWGAQTGLSGLSELSLEFSEDKATRI